MAWQHTITMIGDRQAQVLIDEQFRTAAPLVKLPGLTWFAVYCQLDPGAAFWHPDETATLDALESTLFGLCEHFGRGWAVYVCRLATRGIREYYLYHGPGAELEKLLPRLRKAYPAHRLEYDVTSDPKWGRYNSLLSALDAT